MNRQSYLEPLTNMEIDEKNIDKWRAKLKYVTIVPNTILRNVNIEELPTDINKRKELYYNRVSFFINRKAPHLLKNLVTINKRNREVDERKKEYIDIMRRYDKSIKYFEDKLGTKVLVRMVLNTKSDKIKAYLQYYKYKKTTKDSCDKDKIINIVDDFILKNLMFGLYVDDIMTGFLIIKKTRCFKIDNIDEKVPTFYIQEVFIDSQWRRRKLACILLEYAILCCPINKKYISLMTFEGNNMVNIAISKGFVLQQTNSDCNVNKLLFIRKIEESDLVKNSLRISPSKSSL